MREIINILHISDFHIGYGLSEKELAKNPSIGPLNSEFHHEKLKPYLIEKFSGIKDLFVIASGDFGDRGIEGNMTDAAIWLHDLCNKLEIKYDRLILVPGNHDLNEEKISIQHHIHRQHFDNANNYLASATYNENEIFARYNNIILDRFGGKKGILYEPDNSKVRFIILNSSRLSTANKLQTDTEYANIEAESTKGSAGYDKNEDIFNRFGLLICNNQNSNLYDPSYRATLNYSENTVQQLFLSNAEREQLQKLKSENEKISKKNTTPKISIVVFHHPSNFLHPFEHITLPDMAHKTGAYELAVETGSLLLCGHIHPPISQEIDKAFTRFPVFIGAGAHIENIEQVGKPIFYSYEFEITDTNTYKWQRTPYSLRNIKLGELEIVEGKKENSLEDLPIIIDEQNTSDIAWVTKVEHIKLTNENEYVNCKNTVANYFKSQFSLLIQKIDKSILIEDEVFNYYKYNKHFPYLKKRIPYLTFGNREKKIVVDFIFSDELIHRESVINRVDEGNDLIGAYKKKGIDLIYYPIIIDALNVYVEKERRSSHIERTLQRQKLIITDLTILGKQPFLDLTNLLAKWYPAKISDYVYEPIAGLQPLCLLTPDFIKGVSSKPNTQRLEVHNDLSRNYSVLYLVT